ncbi:glucose PTS transporter subunit IIA [Clostridium aestuarii]|uniref:Glucose PTS transporter subunit IIA n=1 Tax=Clostridium aestuarii TaxID=338193 RepID=A0ABT4CXQ6_9CLOT|nr:PTS transporter subunit IIABC [Clostridium aestuarii]MCY6483642.1 glucose PTS transporter subunit IIA [Clostridium aestuarii]
MAQNKKNIVFSILQKIGKSLMLPVSVLPAAGILLRLGQDDLLGKYGQIFRYLATAGGAVFENLPMIFAVGVAIGFSGGKSVAALSAVVGQVILQSVLEAASEYGIKMAAQTAAEAQNVSLDIFVKTSKYSEIVKVNQIHIGVFGGIVIGLLAAVLYKKYHRIKLPQVLGFFGGKRFVPIITSVAAVVFAIIAVIIWPPIQVQINIFANWASNSVLGPAFYAAGKRLLIPVGLHHIYYPVFLYEFGEYVVNGVSYFGDSTRYFLGDPTAGVFMAAEYPILMFALPGAAAAIIAAANKENRKKVTGMMLSAAFVSFLTGITEPIEFSFIFIAPMLFIFHVFAAFISGIVTSILNIRLGYTFSASAIDYILGFKFAEHPWLIWPVGIVFFVLYFVVFYFFIKTKDIKTPGREENEDHDIIPMNISGNAKTIKILEAIGGENNVEGLDSCITRLRLNLKDTSKVNKKALKSLGSAGIFQTANNIQVIFGTEAEKIKDDIQAIIDNKNFYKKNVNDEESLEEKNSISKLLFAEIENPIDGEIVSLDKVPDDVFAERILGDGFAVKPEDNRIYSPVDGEISVMFPTKHAVSVNSSEGLEVLVHVGIDTVKLNGEGFTTYVNQGDIVKKGDLLISFNKTLVDKKAKSLIVPVIVTNMNKVKEINVKYGNELRGKKVAEIEME